MTQRPATRRALDAEKPSQLHGRSAGEVQSVSTDAQLDGLLADPPA
jgi:hypothetical protein